MKKMRAVLNDLVEESLSPGEFVKAIRSNYGITQDQICEVTGLQRANLSALKNERLEMTVHYAEILGVALGLHPSTILFPNGYYEKSKDILEIEKKARAVFKKVLVG